MKTDPKRQGGFRLRSPAKITPWLHVLNHRPDGYHEVNLGLAPVSIYDRLEFQPLPSPGSGAEVELEVESAEELGPPAENLVWRAASAIQRAVGEPIPVAIRLVKAIPSGAGLGGGSGNAAATLLALNRLAGAPLGPEQLEELARALGSDVPFFLNPRPSLAEGRGERLLPLPQFPTAELLVVKPAFSISTAAAYSRCPPRARPLKSPPNFTTLESLAGWLDNDFEAILFPDYPELAEIKAHLLGLGAAGALLSGTGSALFGVFRDSTSRDRAELILSEAGRWSVIPCAILRTHDYFGVSDPATPAGA